MIKSRIFLLAALLCFARQTASAADGELTLAMGHAYGHREVWRFSSKWREGVADVGSRQMRYVRDLFATRAWWKLRPDTENALVPSRIERVSPGDENYATAARASDGSFAIVYLPAGRPVVVDARTLGARTAVKWFDPTDGSQQSAEGKPWRDTRWQQFTPPAKNAAGDADFVLILEAVAADPPAQAQLPSTGLKRFASAQVPSTGVARRLLPAR